MKRLTTEDVITGLRKLNINANCRECGYENAIIPTQLEEDENGKMTDQMEYSSIVTTTPGGQTKKYESILIICGRCGHVRSFLVHNINKALGKVVE